MFFVVIISLILQFITVHLIQLLFLLAIISLIDPKYSPHCISFRDLSYILMIFPVLCVFYALAFTFHRFWMTLLIDALPLIEHDKVCELVL